MAFTEVYMSTYEHGVSYRESSEPSSPGNELNINDEGPPTKQDKPVIDSAATSGNEDKSNQ